MAVAILTNRSNLYISEGRFREAIPDFDYLISTNSRNFIYYYDRALAKHATNDISGAMLDYKKALELQPDDQLTKNQIKRLTGK
jgi:tetratricopeptide (TPR) repeat protein